MSMTSRGDWSEPASFEAGLLDKSDWTAKWITADLQPTKKKALSD